MDEFERETSEYLNGYDQYLTTQTTLKAKTIASHKGKARLFALDYLARREGEAVKQGMYSIGIFFSYFYI